MKPRQEEDNDSGPIREDRFKDEPPIGADENGNVVLYATIEEAKAATAARKITIIKASGSEDPEDLSDIGKYSDMYVR